MQNIGASDHEHPSSVHADPTLASLQAEVHLQRELLEKNNHMLKSIRRAMRFSAVLSALYLLILVVPILVAAWILPPYITKITQTYNAVQQGGATLPQGLDLKAIKDLLNKSGAL